MADAPIPAIRDGAMPKHAQVRDALLRRCRHDLAPDDAVPSERELMTQLGVSRATIRRAIGDLVQQGILVRTPGKGTFVARPPVESHLHLASFTQDMQRRGHRPSTLVLAAGLTVPTADVATTFQTPTGTPHWRVNRLRLADDTPMAYELGWYNATLVPDLVPRHVHADPATPVTRSLYELFATDYGLIVDAADQTLVTRIADEATTRILHGTAPLPVLVFDRRSSAGGRPLESVVSYYRGDRYRLHMSLDSSMPQI